MKKLFIIAPNDRFNYGDLLFPHIITAYFRTHFDEIRYCSTTQSDLSYKGGIPTESFRILYNIKPEDDNYLIVAGGECLCVEWGVIISFISERYTEVLLRIEKRIQEWSQQRRWRLRNFIGRKLLRAKTFFPFTIGKNELPRFNGIFYNSLGGGGLANEMFVLHYRKVQKILKSVDYISVRDKATSEILNSINVVNTVVADSAILIAEIFPEEVLQKRINPELLPFLEKQYIFFQCNETIASRNLSRIVDELGTIREHFGCEICFCPIGTAAGHSDDIGLSRIYDQLQNTEIAKSCHKVENPSIYDIMWLIKHARLYVGSSLHGVITAMSFQVPYCGFCVEKVWRYIETWGDRQCFSPQIDHLADSCIYAYTQSDSRASEIQKESVKVSFEKMKSFLPSGV